MHLLSHDKPGSVPAREPAGCAQTKSSERPYTQHRCSLKIAFVPCVRHTCAVAVLASTLLLTSLLTTGAHADQSAILVGSEVDYPPFATIDAEGRPTGFSIELLHAIAAEMNLRTEIRVGPWAEIRQAFERRELELLPHMAISEERRRYAAFSVPHTVMHGAVFTRADARRLERVEDMARLQLIVMRGDIAHDYAQSMGWCGRCVVVDTTSDAMRSLAAGKGDAVLAGRLLGMQVLQQQGIQDIVPQPIALPGFVQKFAIAVHKDDPDLLAAINEGLAIIKQKGVYDRVYERWLGVYEAREQIDVRAWLIRGAIAAGAVTLGMGLLMFVQMQRKLRRTVAERTAELSALQQEYAHTLGSQSGMVLKLRAEAGSVRIVHGHGVLLERLGLDRDAIAGRRLADVFEPAIAEKLEAAALRARADGTASVDCAAVARELVFTASLRVTETAIATEPGTEIVAACMEITSRVRMEEELREAVLAAEKASRTKSEFLSRASHEIRTPLTGIIGCADILQESETEPRLQRYLGTIQDCSHSLLQVLNDLLDLGKIELGAIPLEYEACDVRAEIDQVLRLFRPTCDRRGVALASAIAADVPGWLWLSCKQVRQVLVNLVGNACKFTAQGTITVEAEIEPRQPADLILVLRVIDTGIGIPPALQSSLFEPFSPAQRRGVSSEAGTGLGLAICKQLCALMDGSIEVSSQEGRGTTFSVRLPSRACRPISQPAEPRPSQVDLAGVRILVAEDNAINQMVAVHLLRALGAEPFVVDNGREALDALDREPFDIVFLDIQMPVMDGLATAQAIRRKHGDELPLIAFTAGTMTHERMECLNSGMNDFVSKPVLRAQLIEVLSKWIGSRDVPATPEA
jgi:signal transduction histidine kinase/ABC-type amino acid transport substrate-binding protein/ActR/RegA family two-component response regulator